MKKYLTEIYIWKNAEGKYRYSISNPFVVVKMRSIKIGKRQLSRLVCSLADENLLQERLRELCESED
jgi:hypothetical protein